MAEPRGGPPGVALVTGASGFVGSHLVDALVEEGWRVRGFVRRTSSLRWLPAGRIELAYGALDDAGGLRAALEGARVVFHLAGLTSALAREAYFRVNVEGTRALLEAMSERAPEALLVFCSSLAAAGPARNGRPLEETDPPDPIGPYGESKLAAERLVAASRLDHVTVRPPAIYGPRDPDILAVFRLAARGLAPRVGPHGQRLSMVHARDLAHGLVDAAERGANRGVFYMSDGAVHTLDEVTEAIASAVGRPARVLQVPFRLAHAAAHVSRLLARAGGSRPLITPERIRDLAQPHWVCDDSRARAELGYESAFTLREGVLDTAAWYRANRWL
jgi:nucleoside-diphosphate-sugar epimerase